MRLKNSAIIFLFLVFTILISEFMFGTTIFRFSTAFSDQLTNEDEAQSHLKAGITLREQGKHDEAIKQKKYDEAIKQYEKAIEKNPDYAAAYNNWCLVLADQKKYDEAIKQCEKAIALNKEFVYAYHITFGNRENMRQVSRHIDKPWMLMEKLLQTIKMQIFIITLGVSCAKYLAT